MGFTKDIREPDRSPMSAFMVGLQQHFLNALWKFFFLLRLLKLRFARPKNEVVVLSLYMSDISQEVVTNQGKIIQRFLPEGVDFLQMRTGFGHGQSIDLFLYFCPYQIIILLDIDCIPTSPQAIPTLIKEAKTGILVGAAQRANHIDNGGHVYVGPFLMGLSKTTYCQLGRPSFSETRRGDVGEELTYRAEALRHEIRLLWPTRCEVPIWHLRDDVYFGRNTIYEDFFLHAFQIRKPEQQASFIFRTRRLLADVSSA
jgi:hypothetical protein